MAPGKGSVKVDPNVFEDGPSHRVRPRPGAAEPPEPTQTYDSAGGGEASSDGTPGAVLRTIFSFMAEEKRRPNHSSAVVSGPDLHTRPPTWMEDKDVGIDGRPLTEAERSSPTHWSNKYSRELAVAEAIQEVKRQRRYEADNDILGFMNRVRRFFGVAEPLSEAAARSHVEARQRLEDEAHHLRAGDTRDSGDDVGEGPSSTHDAHPVGVIPRNDPTTGPDAAAAGAAAAFASGAVGSSEYATVAAAHRNGGLLKTPWMVVMESIETGRPLTRVANEYRPRVDYYGLDAFLDSAPSVVWFSTKCGIAVGLAHGTAKAMQAMNVDVQFLKASGVGVLSILNMSVFASVVKWGGNTALFACAFCVGDRLMRRIKTCTLPPHDAQCRSTSNYVMGLALSGAMVGVLPWWVLNDAGLALRMAASGLVVGGALGLMVGLSMQQLVALNTGRLDATKRQLRRYEALVHRQRGWAAQVRSQYASTAYVWW